MSSRRTLRSFSLMFSYSSSLPPHNPPPPAPPSVTVGDGQRNWRSYKQGGVLIFEDSFEHEVIWSNDAVGEKDDFGMIRRVVLILDFFHPNAEAHHRDFGRYRRQ